MALPVAFKDELVARSDIVDVVSDYVTLTPKGGSFWGLCPMGRRPPPSMSCRTVSSTTALAAARGAG